MVSKIFLLSVVFLSIILQTSCHHLRQRDNSIQQLIYENAKRNIGDKSWAKSVKRQAKRNQNVIYNAGDWKCNLFVYEIILASGLDIGTYECGSRLTPPVCGDWYGYKSPLIINNADLIGEDLNKAIPGDIITDGIHMGIIAGNGKTISAGEFEILHNNWGYRGTEIIPVRIFRIKTSTNRVRTLSSISSDINTTDNQNDKHDSCYYNQNIDDYYIQANDLNRNNTINDNQLYNEKDKDNSENKKSPWLWIGIGIGIFVLITLIIIIICCCKH